MSPECRACVVIPVRDEAATLRATLGALSRQVDSRGLPLSRSWYEVIVLANNCRDGTADLARRFGAAEPSLSLHVVEIEIPAKSAHVGTARRLSMDEACRRLLATGRDRGVIASTDGDTRVAPDWVASILEEVAAGADAVGGDVRIKRAGRATLGRPARDAYLIDLAYRRLVDELEARLDRDPADSWPRHHHHTGASLAVTAGAYRRVGGLPPLPSSEDLALVSALRRFDLKLRHSPKVRVVTSARRSGRAPGGMADTLRRWSATGPSILVEHPDATEARAVLRRGLRGLWRAWRRCEAPSRPEFSPAEMAGRIGVSDSTLALLLETSPTFGLLIEAVERESLQGGPCSGDAIDVSEAIALLRAKLAILRCIDPGHLPASNRLEEVDPISLLSPPAQVA